MTSTPALTDHDELADTLRSAWNLDVVGLVEASGELDLTLRATGRDGRRHSVKSRIAEPDDQGVDVELAALHHLAGAASPVPTIRPTIDGADRVHLDGRTLWVLDWMEGVPWAELGHRSQALEHDLGAAAAQLSIDLAGFGHPGAARTHHWDLRSLDRAVGEHTDQLTSDTQRRVADKALGLFAHEVSPRIGALSTSVVHQDLNDHNVLVRRQDGQTAISGLIDFGDLLHTVTVAELAVPVAYAMLRHRHPVDAAAAVVAGWTSVAALTPDELAVVFPLAMGRLLVNATTWAARHAAQPDYADARSRHTWATLQQLLELPAAFVHERLRNAAGFDRSGIPAAHGTAQHAAFPAGVAVVDLDPHREVFDGVAVTDAASISAAGRPDEPHALAHDRVRFDLGGPADGHGGPATVQLGVAVRLQAGADPVIACPADGTAVSVGQDLVLHHHIDGRDHWTLWRGLISTVAADQVLAPGDPLGRPDPTDPDVRVQLLTFCPGPHEVVPDVIRPVDRSAWTRLSSDPCAFLGLDAPPPTSWSSNDEVAALRDQRLAASQRYYYREPMTLVRASDVTFADSGAHHYLDALNNVTHVGHGNHRVVEAASRQLRRLNTNSRFVYGEMGRYADRLARLLPDPLEVVFLVCTGSEANDLALRISRQVTGREDVMVIAGAYHGNTTAVTGISPNRYRGPGGEGPPPTTHEVEQPNRYRGRYRYDDPDAGVRYAATVREVGERMVLDGRPPAAFIAESLMGTAGQVVFPEHYLRDSFAAVRSLGGLCISDEVQVGFGRLGHHFWGFELGGVVPDIVTMGKPMGNGQPIAAVVTTRAIADAFDQGMKYFNTFGGNPVSCAIAGAVLDEIEDRHLQAHALDTGARFAESLRLLADRHDVIGDVRGEGLYLGVELVTDRTTREPASALTTELCERMREHGVLMYPNGDLGNCLKIKPPMVFADADVDRFVSVLDTALDELTT